MYICEAEGCFYCWRSQGWDASCLKKRTLNLSIVWYSLAVHSFECKKCFLLTPFCCSWKAEKSIAAGWWNLNPFDSFPPLPLCRQSSVMYLVDAVLITLKHSFSSGKNQTRWGVIKKFWRGCKEVPFKGFFFLCLWISVFWKKEMFKSLSQSSRKFCRNILCHYFLQYFYLVTIITIKNTSWINAKLRNLPPY